MDSGTLDLNLAEGTVQLAYQHRAGTRPPLVCLHGFGSTKEDYADLSMRPNFGTAA